MSYNLKSLDILHFGVWIAFLGFGLMAGQASAAVICGVTNTNAINSTGSVIVIRSTFVTPVTQRVDIKYNAECSIAGVPTNWLNTDIVIDGVPCPPSNSDNALCSGNHTATQHDGWVSAVTNCVRILPAGAHTVFVQVNPNPAGVPWRIDDQSLKCEN
jgi:hypothetical protein